MAKYVFDSNIFINLQRRQPLDVFPSLWVKIGELMDDGTIISSQEGGKKKNSADPFVIALAKQQNCKVVTEEVPTHNMNSPKIPDVCAAYNIECIDFIAFAREEKFAF